MRLPDTVNKNWVRMHSTAQDHKKMYKAKKQWIVASATLISLIGAGGLIHANASRIQTTQPSVNKTVHQAQNTKVNASQNKQVINDKLNRSSAKPSTENPVNNLNKNNAHAKVNEPQATSKLNRTVQEQPANTASQRNNKQNSASKTNLANSQVRNNSKANNKTVQNRLAHNPIFTNLEADDWTSRTVTVHGNGSAPSNPATSTIPDLSSNPVMLNLHNAIKPIGVQYPGGGSDAGYNSPHDTTFGGYTAPTVDGIGGSAITDNAYNPLAPGDDSDQANGTGQYSYGSYNVPIYKVYVPKGASSNDYQNVWFYGRLFGGSGTGNSGQVINGKVTRNTNAYSANKVWFTGADIGITDSSTLPNDLDNDKIQYVAENGQPVGSPAITTGLPGFPIFVSSHPSGLDLSKYHVLNPSQQFTYDNQTHDVKVGLNSEARVFTFNLHIEHHNGKPDTVKTWTEKVAEVPGQGNSEYDRSAKDFLSGMTGYQLDTSAGGGADNNETSPVIQPDGSFSPGSPASYYYAPLSSKDADSPVKPYTIKFVNQAGNTVDLSGNYDPDKTYRIDGYMNDSGSISNLVKQGDGLGGVGVPQGYKLNPSQTPDTYKFDTNSHSVTIGVIGDTFPITFTVHRIGHNTDPNNPSTDENYKTINTTAQVGSPSRRTVSPSEFTPDGYTDVSGEPTEYLNVSPDGELTSSQDGREAGTPIPNAVTYNYNDDTSNTNDSPNTKVKGIVVNYINQQGQKIASAFVNDRGNNGTNADKLSQVDSGQVSDQGYSINPGQNEPYNYRLKKQSVDVYVNGNQYSDSFNVNSVKELYDGGTAPAGTSNISITNRIGNPSNRPITAGDADAPLGYKLDTTVPSDLEPIKPYFIYKDGNGVMVYKNNNGQVVTGHATNIYFKPMKSSDPDSPVKPITITYYNQHGDVVGHSIIQGFMDHHENAYQLGTDYDNGAKMPEGYHINSSQTDTAMHKFGLNGSNVRVDVMGNIIPIKISIKRYLETPDYAPQSPLNRRLPDVADINKLRVGDKYKFYAKNYVPAGYQIDPKHGSFVEAIANPDGTLQYNGDSFMYMAKTSVNNSKNPNDVKSIRVNYKTNDGQLISSKVINGYMDDEVNLLDRASVPDGYQLVPGQNPLRTFTTGNAKPVDLFVTKAPVSMNYITHNHAKADVYSRTISPTILKNNIYVQSDFTPKNDKANHVEFNSHNKSYNWFTGQPMDNDNVTTPYGTIYTDNQPSPSQPKQNGFQQDVNYPGLGIDLSPLASPAPAESTDDATDSSDNIGNANNATNNSNTGDAGDTDINDSTDTSDDYGDGDDYGTSDNNIPSNNNTTVRVHKHHSRKQVPPYAHMHRYTPKYVLQYILWNNKHLQVLHRKFHFHGRVSKWLHGVHKSKALKYRRHIIKAINRYVRRHHHHLTKREARMLMRKYH